MDDRIVLTREGFDKMKAELDYLTTKKRAEIAADLKFARGLGDLRENAEYDTAKNQQALNERRIAELGDRLSRAQIMDEDRISSDQAYLGTRVTLKDLKTDETIEYQLVSAEEADFKENKISVTSPVGRAILGKKLNDVVTVKVPAGDLRYEVTKIGR